MWIEFTQNKTINKTIKNVVYLYLITTIVLVLLISIYYTQNQKKQIFQIYTKQVKIQSDFIKDRLESLHDNIIDEIAIYPRLDNIESAIYDIDKKKIFSTFNQKIYPIDQNFFIKDTFYYFVYNIDPYYLGAAYLVIQVPSGLIFNDYYAKIVLIVSFIILFLVLTSFALVKILIRPLANNVMLLDRFIKDTTHELNTPLSTILANIEMLDLNDLNEKNNKKIERIKIASKTISTIYEDLSFLLLYNKEQSNNENINIAIILNQRINYFTTLAESKNIDFILDIDAKIFLLIDKIKIERVFDNLISNSIKYSKLNSTIFIYLKKNHFTVKDNGIGMDPKEIDEIFTRYKRFNTNVGGFGIGYSIIYSIIKEYNISIEIDSNKNKGTRVTLRW